MGGTDVRYSPPVGQSFNSMDMLHVYDPKLNAWEQKSSMPTARWGLASVSVNNKILAIGGGDKYHPEKSLNIVEEYDPITDTWVNKSPMPLGRIASIACEIGEMVYVSGGGGLEPNDAYRDLYMYDPACDTIK